MIPDWKNKNIKKTYHNHTNVSYKKLTEKEKKSIWFLKTIYALEKKAKILSKLRYITNEIATNACYHEKNMEHQFNNFMKAQAPKKEIDLMRRTYNLKHELAKSLMKDLEEFIHECEKELNKKN